MINTSQKSYPEILDQVKVMIDDLKYNDPQYKHFPIYHRPKFWRRLIERKQPCHLVKFKMIEKKRKAYRAEARSLCKEMLFSNQKTIRKLSKLI